MPTPWQSSITKQFRTSWSLPKRVASGVMDFSESEVQELGIAEDSDYTLICKKGEVIFKIKDNIQLAPEMPADVGLDTSILPL